MRTSRTRVPAALAALSVLTLFTALPAAPLAGQETGLAAKAPPGARVYRFDIDAWEEPVCAGATEWTFQVPAGQWIEFPIGWMAADHATAVQNWDHMSFEIQDADGTVLDVPEGLNWNVSETTFECPDQTLEGVAVSPVVYVPPVEGERSYRIRYLFNADVDDGWNVYPEGSDLDITITLKAVDEEGGG